MTAVANDFAALDCARRRSDATERPLFAKLLEEGVA